MLNFFPSITPKYPKKKKIITQFIQHNLITPIIFPRWLILVTKSTFSVVKIRKEKSLIPRKSLVQPKPSLGPNTRPAHIRRSIVVIVNGGIRRVRVRVRIRIPRAAAPSVANWCAIAGCSAAYVVFYVARDGCLRGGGGEGADVACAADAVGDVALCI